MPQEELEHLPSGLQVQILCTRVMAQTFCGLQKIQELEPDARMS